MKHKKQTKKTRPKPSRNLINSSVSASISSPVSIFPEMTTHLLRRESRGDMDLIEKIRSANKIPEELACAIEDALR